MTEAEKLAIAQQHVPPGYIVIGVVTDSFNGKAGAAVTVTSDGKPGRYKRATAAAPGLSDAIRDAARLIGEPWVKWQ